jgi:hypothetical protein
MDIYISFFGSCVEWRAVIVIVDVHNKIVFSIINNQSDEHY